MVYSGAFRGALKRPLSIPRGPCRECRGHFRTIESEIPSVLFEKGETQMNVLAPNRIQILLFQYGAFLFHPKMAAAQQSFVPTMRLLRGLRSVGRASGEPRLTVEQYKVLEALVRSSAKNTIESI